MCTSVILLFLPDLSAGSPRSGELFDVPMTDQEDLAH
ncbi:hypothetical protein PSE_4281 [Pseudovibrio sp. FO-BEG1]|nr:hypothetical protein PSE_4281 [Pseudovibrio sp. FO-BEG1]